MTQDIIDTKILIEWINHVLSSEQMRIERFPEDVTNGVMLIGLYQALVGPIHFQYEKKPKFTLHKTSNVLIVLEQFKEQGVKLPRISAQDIAQGNEGSICRFLSAVARTFVPVKEIMAAVTSIAHRFDIKMESTLKDTCRDGRLFTAIATIPSNHIYDTTYHQHSHSEAVDHVLHMTRERKNVFPSIHSSKVVEETIAEIELYMYISILISQYTSEGIIYYTNTKEEEHINGHGHLTHCMDILPAEQAKTSLEHIETSLHVDTSVEEDASIEEETSTEKEISLPVDTPIEEISIEEGERSEMICSVGENMMEVEDMEIYQLKNKMDTGGDKREKVHLEIRWRHNLQEMEKEYKERLVENEKRISDVIIECDEKIRHVKMEYDEKMRDITMEYDEKMRNMRIERDEGKSKKDADEQQRECIKDQLLQYQTNEKVLRDEIKLLRIREERLPAPVEEERYYQMEREMMEESRIYDENVQQIAEIKQEIERMKGECEIQRQIHQSDNLRLETISHENKRLNDEVNDLQRRMKEEEENSDDYKARILILSSHLESICVEKAIITQKHKKYHEIVSRIKKLEMEKNSIERKAQESMDSIAKIQTEKEEMIRKMKKKLEQENEEKAREKQSVANFRREKDKLVLELKSTEVALIKQTDEVNRLRLRRDYYKKEWEYLVTKNPSRTASDSTGSISSEGSSVRSPVMHNNIKSPVVYNNKKKYVFF